MNKVFLVGRLTKEVELRSTKNEKSVATFSLATDRRMKNAAGEKVSDFHNIVVWGSLADLCAKYLNKGDQASVVGEIQNRSYEANDGSKRYITEVIADEVQFLSPKGAKVKAEAEENPTEGFTEIEDNELPF